MVLGYGRPRRLLLFFLGTVLSQLALAAAGAWPSDWKSGLAYPVTLGALALVDARKGLLTFLVLASLGFLHLLLDFRIFGALCLVSGAAALLKGARFSARAKVLAAVAGLLGALVFTLVYRSDVGLTQTGADLQRRRQDSNAERLAGLIVAYASVRESPVLGHGSWARSDEALDTWAMLQEQLGGRQASDVRQEALLSPEGSVIRAHSGILQAWVEAGVIGLSFFIFTLLAVLKMLYRLARRKHVDRHYALVCFLGLWTVWAFLMSPFAGGARLYIAISIALLFVAGHGVVEAHNDVSYRATT
jgi:O-antigen ligase